MYSTLPNASRQQEGLRFPISKTFVYELKAMSASKRGVIIFGEIPLKKGKQREEYGYIEQLEIVSKEKADLQRPLE